MKHEKKERLRALGFGSQVENIDKGKCAFGCDLSLDEVGNPVFRDEVSAREFGISGFCQKCQDKTFGR